MQATTGCPSSDQLNRLLHDQLDEADQCEVGRHLESCEACQAALENLAADSGVWREAAQSLAEPARVDDALRNVMDAQQSGVGETHTEAALGHDVELDFLEPSDDLQHLGRLGGYEVTDVIGYGGMGVVLKGHDAHLNRFVAIKVLMPELASNANARKRFRREGRAAAAVNHVHVATIHAVDEINGMPLLVMEFIAGKSLEQRLSEEEPLQVQDIVRIGMQTAAGLAAAHAQGLVHRDIKPANILLENSVERVKISDFGLARAVDDVRITRPGVVTGTPEYMSPEQARGEAVDHRADLFSLGCVMYAMCAGRSPFRADSTPAVIHRVCSERPRPISDVNPDIPGWLIAVIDKLLAKNPEERFQSAAEVSRLLEQYLAHLQQPSAVPEPPRPSTIRPRARRTRRALELLRMPAVVALLLIVGISLTDAAGLTEVASTVIRVVRGDGTLEIRVDDPDISVAIDGADVVITGAGVQEIRLTPGEHEIQYLKNGEPIHQQLVLIERGGRRVVEVNLEHSKQAVTDDDGQAQRERVWAHSGLEALMSVSLNGRYVAFRDPDTRGPAIHDLTSGDDRTLTANGPDGEEYTTEAVFSPDGNWLAYNWSNGDYEQGSGLHIVRIDGTETRQVLPQEPARWIQPCGWTPDGREILCRLKGEDQTQIAFVAVNDGAVRVVKTLDMVIWQHPILALSPDGQTIAFEMPIGDNHSDPSDVFLLSADGRREYVVRIGRAVDHGIDDHLLGWTPNGRLLVKSDRYNDRAWLVQVIDGKPSGYRSLVWEGWQSHQQPGQFTAEGAYFYQVRGSYPDPAELWVRRNWLPAHEAADPVPQREYRTVWSDPQLVAELFSVSPDETVLAFRDDSTGDLAVRNLVDGTSRRLSRNTVAWESYPDNVRVSPDGRYIACEWRSEHGRKTDLRLFAVGGGEPRVLYTPDGTDVLQARPQDWSPDGETLLVRLTNDDVTNGTTRIALMSVEDGSVQILKQPSYRWQGNDGCGLRFSPDGRYIAYEFQPEDGGTDIALMSLDGKHDTVLVEHWANNEIIDWTPDGSALLFGSDRRSNLNDGYWREAWLIDVVDGRPRGKPRMLNGTRGISEYGEFAADGSLYHVMPGRKFVQDVFVATIDPDNGTVLQEPVRASSRFPGVTRSAAWSPDGRFLAYYANMPVAPDSLDLPHKRIVLRSTETDEEREIMLPTVHRGRGVAWETFGGEMLRWSPDGASLLLDGLVQSSLIEPAQWGIYQLDVQTGEATTIDTTGRSAALWQHGWSADGAHVVLSRGFNDESSATRQYLLRNIHSSGTIEIHQQFLDRAGGGSGFVVDGAVSPDGSRLALLQQTDDDLSVLSVPMTGGEPKQLFQTTGQEYNTEIAGRCLAWTPNGTHLLFNRQTRQPISLRRYPRLQELWRIPADGGEPQPLEFAASGLLTLDIHPDGRRVAYTRVQPANELRVTNALLEVRGTD